MAVLPDGRVLHTQRAGALRSTTPATGVTEVVNNSTCTRPASRVCRPSPSTRTSRPTSGSTSTTRLDGGSTTPGGNAPGTLPAGQTEAYWDQWKGYDVLSRFKWDARHSLDLASEQQIIKVETNRGGARTTPVTSTGTRTGNLYLSIGDNTSARRRQRPGLRADQRLSGIESRHSILVAARATRTTCAARSCASRSQRRRLPTRSRRATCSRRGTQRRAPEIYVMGAAQPVPHERRPASGTLVWGDYGPDAGRDDAQPRPDGPRRVERLPRPAARTTAAGPTASRHNRPYNNWDFVTRRLA